MRVFAPAKINLHLRVGPLRADGFHPLLTWMTTIGLRDELQFDDATDTISMTCSEASLPCDDRNIVIKAAKMIQPDTRRAVRIHLEKQIPHGGGLGGGSSDAALTLVALNRLWKLEKATNALHQLAGRLGSDVPFFLHGTSSICKGRGEVVRPIATPAQARWVLLLLPDLSMPTPAVYRQFDAMKLGDLSTIEQEPNWNHWASLPSLELLANLVNDLEFPAFSIESRLGRLRIDLERKLNRPVRMSGSGSSLFTLYDNRADADHAAAQLFDQSQLRAIVTALAPV